MNNLNGEYRVLKAKYIQEIWEYCKHTHSEKDYEDLWQFGIDELSEILINTTTYNE